MNRRSRLEDPTKASSWKVLARKCGFQTAHLAEEAGVSEAHLRRMCREAFGLSFGQWLRHERMVAARQLLGETLSVKVTSDRLGYVQRTHFSRDFRRAYGVTAAEWLRRFKQELAR